MWYFIKCGFILFVEVGFSVMVFNNINIMQCRSFACVCFPVFEGAMQEFLILKELREVVVWLIAGLKVFFLLNVLVLHENLLDFLIL